MSKQKILELANQTSFGCQKSTGQWYVDLPEYPGPKAVTDEARADTFLDRLASEEPFAGSEQLKLIQECDGSEGGEDYILENTMVKKSTIRYGFVK